MFRIASVYGKNLSQDLKSTAMDTTSWLQVSRSLARCGYNVDIILKSKDQIVKKNENLRFISVNCVNWQEYDVIMTHYHKGFQFLAEHNGANHPLIISLLGSVIASREAEGVHFFKEQREILYDIQNKIANKSRYVFVLTEQSRQLWLKEYGSIKNVLLVPTGVNKDIPPPINNPYCKYKEKIAVYIGNIYKNGTQREVNLIWQNRLNALGRLLRSKGIRLCFIGVGEVDQLDNEAVTYFGTIENDKIWDYQYFADAAIVFALGETQHNESSKIYYYLRTGLPVISERPVPNNNIIEQTNCGYIVDYNDPQAMAGKIDEAVQRRWPKTETIDYMVKHHTWDQRAQEYHRIIMNELLARV